MTSPVASMVTWKVSYETSGCFPARTGPGWNGGACLHTGSLGEEKNLPWRVDVLKIVKSTSFFVGGLI